MIQPAVANDAFAIQNVDGRPSIDVVGPGDRPFARVPKRGPVHLVFLVRTDRFFGRVMEREKLPPHCNNLAHCRSPGRRLDT